MLSKLPRQLLNESRQHCGATCDMGVSRRLGTVADCGSKRPLFTGKLNYPAIYQLFLSPRRLVHLSSRDSLHLRAFNSEL